MKKKGVIKYAKEMLSWTLLFFTVRLLLYIFLDEPIDFPFLIGWSLFMGITFTLTDNWMKKLIRPIAVAMHGEEKVKQNEEKAALKNQPWKN